MTEAPVTPANTPMTMEEEKKAEVIPTIETASTVPSLDIDNGEYLIRIATMNQFQFIRSAYPKMWNEMYNHMTSMTPDPDNDGEYSVLIAIMNQLRFIRQRYPNLWTEMFNYVSSQFNPNQAIPRPPPVPVTEKQRKDMLYWLSYILEYPDEFLSMSKKPTDPRSEEEYQLYLRDTCMTFLCSLDNNRKQHGDQECHFSIKQYQWLKQLFNDYVEYQDECCY